MQVIYLNDQSGTSFFKNHNDDNDINLGTLLNHRKIIPIFIMNRHDYEEVAYIEGKQNRFNLRFFYIT